MTVCSTCHDTHVMALGASAESRIAKLERDLARVTKQRDAAETAMRAAVEQRTALRSEIEEASAERDRSVKLRELADMAVVATQAALHEAKSTITNLTGELERAARRRGDAETIARNALATGSQLRRDYDALRGRLDNARREQAARGELSDVERERDQLRREFDAERDELAAQVAAMQPVVTAAERWADDVRIEDRTVFDAVAAYRGARRADPTPSTENHP